MTRDHVNEAGQFQSDLFPWCRPGYVPMKLTDRAARLILSLYVCLCESDHPALFDLRRAIAKAEAATDGEESDFQSHEHPWCKAGFMPLEVSDPMAQIALRWYAQLREPVDAAFSDDLRLCIAQTRKGESSDER